MYLVKCLIKKVCSCLNSFSRCLGKSHPHTTKTCNIYIFRESAKWNSDDWMKLCRDIGATYIILTAKHHDGICLWNTDTTDKKSHRNILSDFITSAKMYGIKYGIYYSWWEFNTSITINFIDTILVPQINELKKYTPDIWWFDGHWNIKTLYAKNTIDKIIFNLLKTKDIWINDRIPTINMQNLRRQISTSCRTST